MVAAIRKGWLSQPRFAQLLGVSVRTLQEWQQGWRAPCGTTWTLLLIAAKNPRAPIEVALRGSSRAVFIDSVGTGVQTMTVADQGAEAWAFLTRGFVAPVVERRPAEWAGALALVRTQRTELRYASCRTYHNRSIHPARRSPSSSTLSRDWPGTITNDGPKDACAKDGPGARTVTTAAVRIPASCRTSSFLIAK